MPQHGASAELGNTTEKSVPACTAQCSADDRCSCVVFTSQSGQCQRMSQCLPSKCAANVQQKTTLVKDYQVIDGLNCFKHHGAVEIDAKPVPNLSQEECIERCEGSSRCAGAVHSLSGPKKGDCWMRADVVLAQCAHVPFQSMLLKPTVVSAGG